MKEPQLSGIAKALAAQGRHGDDTLVHVSRKELAMLERMGDGIGVHMTKNPQTGLPEAFNWLGTLGGIAGGIVGTIIAPGAGTAAGAALGSGLGTAAGGGSLKQSLMAGVIGGITGYAGAGIAGGLASAGEQAVAQGVAEGVTEGVSQTAAQGITQGATDVASQGVTQATTDAASQGTLQSLAQQGAQQAGQVSNALLPQASSVLAEGSSKAAGSVVGDAFVPNAVPLQSTPLSYGDKLAAGWNQITSSPKAFGDFASDNAKGLISTGMGLMGVGAIQPTETSIVTPTTSSDKGYRGETYIDPATGQMRTRAVKLAEGGSFSDYDAVDAESDGGYSPGGGVGYAPGGDIDAGGTKAGLEAFYSESPDDEVINGVNWTQAAKLGTVRPQNGLAKGGGIGDLGSYSDGGRMLRGPGDGVSDSIPASIEDKRPARLADGEFVVPARAVSELGNGSTEAGSKQLYAMLDRIAAKRKSGKGLAYNANPKKLMPA